MFEQDRILVRLQQKVLSTSAIVACFISGSYGRRQEDAYSDIDVALVFRSDSGRDIAWERRRPFAQDISPYVPVKSFDAVHVRPFLHIALFSNGSKLDFRYESKESLTPNPWDSDIRILKDDNGWAETHQSQSAQLRLPVPKITAVQLAEIDQRFWVMFWDVFRLVLRGDFDKPFPIYIQLLHYTIPPLLTQLPSGSTARSHLLNANFGGQATVTRHHLAQLLNGYVSARNEIIQDQHLDIELDRKFETAVIQLVERHA